MGNGESTDMQKKRQSGAALNRGQSGYPSPSSPAPHPPSPLGGRRRRRVDRRVDKPNSPDEVDHRRRRSAEDDLQARVETPAAAARSLVCRTVSQQVGRAVRLAARGTGRVRHLTQAVDIPRKLGR